MRKPPAVTCEYNLTNGCDRPARWRVQTEMNEQQHDACDAHLIIALNWAFEHGNIPGPIILVERLAS